MKKNMKFLSHLFNHLRYSNLLMEQYLTLNGGTLSYEISLITWFSSARIDYPSSSVGNGFETVTPPLNHYSISNWGRGILLCIAQL